MRKVGLFLLILAVSGVLLPVVVCADTCPEDDGGEECPPVCSLCASCPRVSGAVVSGGPSVAPASEGECCAPSSPACPADAPPRDILHVPLAA